MVFTSLVRSFVGPRTISKGGKLSSDQGNSAFSRFLLRPCHARSFSSICKTRLSILIFDRSITSNIFTVLPNLLFHFEDTVKPPISGQSEKRTPPNNGQKVEVPNELL